MLIALPDPHPGRCQNYRNGNRCLDYDLHKERCRFQDGESDPFGWQFQSRSWIFSTEPPKPWVSPLAED